MDDQASMSTDKITDFILDAYNLHNSQSNLSHVFMPLNIP